MWLTPVRKRTSCSRQTFDLLLDLMLPGRCGLEVRPFAETAGLRSKNSPVEDARGSDLVQLASTRRAVRSRDLNRASDRVQNASPPLVEITGSVAGEHRHRAIERLATK